MELTPEEIVARLQKRFPMHFEVLCSELVIEKQQAEIQRLKEVAGGDQSSDS